MSSSFLEATRFEESVATARTVDAKATTMRSRPKTLHSDVPCRPGESLLELAFEAAGMLGPLLENTKRAVRCPWESEHTSGATFDSSTVLFPPRAGSDMGHFHCSHTHCKERGLDEVLRALPAEAVNEARQRRELRRAAVDGSRGSAAAAASPNAATGEQATANPVAPKENLTDVGNARRLVARHGANLRYCFSWKTWLVWNGQTWEKDERGSIELLAKDTVEKFLEDTVTSPTTEAERKARFAHGLRSEDARRIAGMVSLARSEPGIPVIPNELDAHDYLLNVENGTLDLRSGTLLPHDRALLLTKKAPVIFDPTATAPTWLTFLQTVMPARPGVVRYIQKTFGYAMTGATSAQVIIFFFGAGANGKTTLVETILRILGSYATQAAPNLLLEKKNESHPTELADLFGRRMVVSTEVDEGRKLSEALVKQLTGGDRVKARFLNRDFFEFRPTHKLFLVGNHKPIIHGCDEGIWRRIRLVPFDVVIPAAERDMYLMDKLWAERSGIFNWLLDGCLAFQREGLAVPPEVEAATGLYRNSMDRIAGFVHDLCVTQGGASSTSKTLFGAYTTWCMDNSEEPVSKKTFGSMLAERGFEPRKMHGLAGWKGIRLKTADELHAVRVAGSGAVGGMGEEGEENPGPFPMPN